MAFVDGTPSGEIEHGVFHRDALDDRRRLDHDDIFPGKWNDGGWMDPLSDEEFEEKLDKYFKTKRDIKRFWNENADHAWIKSNIIPVHDLGYYDTGGEYGEKDLSILDFIKKKGKLEVFLNRKKV